MRETDVNGEWEVIVLPNGLKAKGLINPSAAFIAEQAQIETTVNAEKARPKLEDRVKALEEKR